MSDPEILTKAAKSLKIIHVITGWNLPGDNEFLKALSEQYVLKLKESFWMLNFTEIIAAFRKNGIVVKDWGKNMNLDLMCQVLGSYCADREKVSYDEEKMKSKPEERIYSQDELDNLSRGDIENFYQRLRNGWVPKSIPGYFRDILLKDGLIENGTKLEHYFSVLLGKGVKNIYVNERS